VNSVVGRESLSALLKRRIAPHPAREPTPNGRIKSMRAKTAV